METDGSNTSACSVEIAAERRRLMKLRLVLVTVILVCMYAMSRAMGLTGLDPESIRRSVIGAGAWGYILYAVMFIGGVFLYIPGMVFVAAGVMVYGTVAGFILAFAAGMGAMCFSFLVVRLIGGRALAGIENPFVKKVLSRLHERPVIVIIILRLLLWLSPPLNYTLAMTDVRLRDYLIGSAVGILPPLAVASILFEWIFKQASGG
ncbi:MAG: TVP38/TMEM64 family protein [Spirochaetes bacterium]|nr:TVP38/TMEM64 family protein [Spirochaetota bacterium]